MNTYILKMLTAGMMANYGFMLNIHDNVLYKTKMDTKEVKLKQNYISVIIKKMIWYKIQLLVEERLSELIIFKVKIKIKNLMILKII